VNDKNLDENESPTYLDSKKNPSTYSHVEIVAADEVHEQHRTQW
jgi:hypothetical protein